MNDDESLEIRNTLADGGKKFIYFKDVSGIDLTRLKPIGEGFKLKPSQLPVAANPFRGYKIVKIGDKRAAIPPLNSSDRQEFNGVSRRIGHPKITATPKRRLDKQPPLKVLVYMDTDDAVTSMKFLKSLTDLLAGAGYRKTKIESVVRGSLRLRLKAWLDGDGGQKAQETGKRKIGEAMLYAEQWAKDAAVNKQRAEISAINASTVQKLLESAKDIANTTVQMDEWLLVKYTDSRGEPFVATRKLSVPEMSVLSKYPAILNKPSEVLEKLALMAYEADPPELAIES